MFVVTVDIWPQGQYAKKYSMLKIVGYNAGPTKGSRLGYDYTARVFDSKLDPLPTDKEIDEARSSLFKQMKSGVMVNVVDHERRNGMEELIRRILVEYNLNDIDRSHDNDPVKKKRDL